MSKSPYPFTEPPPTVKQRNKAYAERFTGEVAESKNGLLSIARQDGGEPVLGFQKDHPDLVVGNRFDVAISQLGQLSLRKAA